jgi:hypothetical protein
MSSLPQAAATALPVRCLLASTDGLLPSILCHVRSGCPGANGGKRGRIWGRLVARQAGEGVGPQGPPLGFLARVADSRESGPPAAVRADCPKQPPHHTVFAAQTAAGLAAIDSVSKETRTPPTSRARRKYVPADHWHLLFPVTLTNTVERPPLGRSGSFGPRAYAQYITVVSGQART